MPRFSYFPVLYFGYSSLLPFDSSTPLPINFHLIQHLRPRQTQAHARLLHHDLLLSQIFWPHSLCRLHPLLSQRRTPSSVSHPSCPPLYLGQTLRTIEWTKTMPTTEMQI